MCVCVCVCELVFTYVKLEYTLSTKAKSKIIIYSELKQNHETILKLKLELRCDNYKYSF